MQSIMYVDLVKLILVGERTSRDIDVVPGLVFDGEDHGVSCVAN